MATNPEIKITVKMDRSTKKAVDLIKHVSARIDKIEEMVINNEYRIEGIERTLFPKIKSE